MEVEIKETGTSIMSIYYNNSSLNLDETNGNVMSNSMSTTTTPNVLVPISPTSNDDDSKSEYTDADDMSAPTELLAEFLSSIMQKDYKNALKYCKLILEYEPNNTTAKDFYPHILAKMNQYKGSSTSEEGSDENFNYTSSEFVDFENENDNDNDVLDNMNADNVSRSSSESISTSHSSSENYFGEENDEGGGNSEDESNSDYMEDKEQHENIVNSITQMSSSSSKSDPRRRVGHTYTTSSSSSSNCSHKEDTSHSYTSLLLEEDDYDQENNNNNNNNNLPSSSAQEHVQEIRAEPSPSSSPLTKKIVEMIRAKCIPSKLPTSSTSKKPK